MLRVRLFFGICIFLLLGSCLALLLTLRDLGRTSNLASGCYQKIATSGSMLSMLEDSESDKREHQPIGRLRHLAPFMTLSPHVRGDLAQLRRLAVDDTEKRSLPEIEALVSHRLAELRATAGNAGSGRRAAVMNAAMTNADDGTMDRLRTAVDRFDRRERTVLAKRTRSMQVEAQRALLITFATVFGVACTALMATLRIFHRSERTERVLAGALENVAEGHTALSKTERQLTAALAREKVIVSELHHRVKNNLQMVASLLQIRARARGGEAAGELQDLAGRMRALGLVQAHVYRTDSFDRVDFSGTLSDIAEQVLAGHGDDNIVLIRDFDGPLALTIVRAVPLALICYEMMLNAIKHARPEKQPGTLRVKLQTKSNPPEIEIQDDGTGFVPEDAGGGLGPRLLRALSGQARAAVNVDSRRGVGTTVKVRLG